jgi:hypothetical protein
VRAQWIVNATGVWVDAVNERLGVEPPHRICFSKGAHLILPRIETRDKALTCVAKDGRIFFVIPWGEVTLVGTTDTPHEAPPCRVRADAADIEYLRSECEAKFNLKLDDADILNTKAGLRPLVRPKNMNKADFLDLARSHKVWADESARMSALWGGKYTDAFAMARELADTVTVAPSDDAGLIPSGRRNPTRRPEIFRDGGGEASFWPMPAAANSLSDSRISCAAARISASRSPGRAGARRRTRTDARPIRRRGRRGHGTPPEAVLAEYREATLEPAGRRHGLSP